MCCTHTEATRAHTRHLVAARGDNSLMAKNCFSLCIILFGKSQKNLIILILELIKAAEARLPKSLTTQRLQTSGFVICVVLTNVRRYNGETLSVLTFQMCPWSSDPDPRGLPDGGVRRCLQPQSAEGGSSGGDGPVGRHPHCSPRFGSQPQDLHVGEGAAGVSGRSRVSSNQCWVVVR